MAKREKELTMRDKKFIKYVAEGYPYNRAAALSSNISTPAGASGVATAIMRKPAVREIILKTIQEEGIDVKEVLQPFIKSLKAKKSADFKGEIFESNVDDLAVQMKAADKLIKMMGYKENEKKDSTVSNNYIQINNMHKEQYSEE